MLIAAGIWVALRVVLPAVVSGQISRALNDAGYANATFRLRGASLYKTSIESLATADGRLRVESVEVTYRPTEALFGQLDTVRIRDALVTLPTVEPSASDPSLPLRRIELEQCVLAMDQDGVAARLPISGTLTAPPAGPAHIELSGGSVSASADPSAQLSGIRTTIELQSLLPPLTNAVQHVAASEVRLAGQQFKDVSVGFELKSANQIRIERISAGWAQGTLSAGSFTITPPSTDVELTVAADRISLDHVLRLLLRGHVTATGTLSGRVPLKYAGSRVTVSQGLLESDGPGTLQLGDSINMFSDVLDQSDPRFRADPSMQQVKQQILNAMADFEYDLIRFVPSRRQDELLIVVQIKGTGRTGAKVPLDITLNLTGFEEGLNTYLGAVERVFRIDRK